MCAYDRLINQLREVEAMRDALFLPLTLDTHD